MAVHSPCEAKSSGTAWPSRLHEMARDGFLTQQRRTTWEAPLSAGPQAGSSAVREQTRAKAASSTRPWSPIPSPTETARVQISGTPTDTQP